MNSDNSNSIESVLQEQRVFPPSEDFASKSRISSFSKYLEMSQMAKSDPNKFWGDAAREELNWFKSFDKVLDWSNPPFAKWFDGGKINISFNCLDRHLNTQAADKIALIWEGEPGDQKKYTYKQLHKEVCKAANALRSIGIGKGDLVALYLSLIHI